MQIAYTSDLHIDSTPHNGPAIRRIVDALRSMGPDVVVVAGDAGNTVEAVDAALALFRPLDCPKFFVSGNHDVWIERVGGRVLDSRAKYAVTLPALCAKHGFHDLDTGPKIIGNVGFAGSLGWYDYSLADPRLAMTHDDYWKGRWGDVIWWDKDMTFWPPVSAGKRSRLRDGEVCAELTAVFDVHLTEIESRVDHIVAVLHTVPFGASIVREDPPYLRDAFTGSADLGAVLAAHDKVRHCIGAHKHVVGDWTVGGIHYHRRPLGRIQSEELIEGAVSRSFGFLEV